MNSTYSCLIFGFVFSMFQWLREESHGHDLLSFEVMIPSTDSSDVNKEMKRLAKAVLAEVKTCPHYNSYCS